MNIYFDESRNTGEIGINGDKLNYFGQRYFVLVGYIEDKSITQSYMSFKDKWNKFVNNGIEMDEIKGTDLLTRKNNSALEEFIATFIKGNNIYVTIYDKKFFLVSQFLNWFFMGLRDFDFNMYHKFLLFLMKVDDYFLTRYINLTKNNSMENIREFVSYIKLHKFAECVTSPFEAMIAVEISQLVEGLDNRGGFLKYLHDTISENVRIKKSDRNNIVNLTALGETILMIKHNIKDLSNNEIVIYHDEIEVVQDYIKNYWKNTKIDFVKSKRTIEVQLADNIASIYGNLISKVLPLNNDNDLHKLLSNDNAWIRQTIRKVFNNIDNNNIKLVVSMREAALVKAFISTKDFRDLLDFKHDILKRLESRFKTELSNHLSFDETNKLFDR